MFESVGMGKQEGENSETGMNEGVVEEDCYSLDVVDD
jgi:hypothetical protein